MHPNDYFYAPVGWLYCRGAITGYADGTFRPYNNTTRGQMVKIVVIAFGIPIYTPPTPTFNDVLPSNVFYPFVEMAFHNAIVTGYACGGPGEPCPGAYFRPNNLVTRAQLSKIVVQAAGWTVITPAVPHFRDVPSTDGFYGFIETAYCHQAITGYSCGTGCAEFRPGNNGTRGQIAKIVYYAVAHLPCVTPTATPTHTR